MGQKTNPKETKSPKKLKSKKLEERIAPGMIGSGVVDPGMTDSGTVPEDTGGTDVAPQAVETEVTSEYLEQDSPAADGHYVDDSSASPAYESSADGAGPVDQPMEYNDTASFDQADAEPSGDYVMPTDSWREPDWVTANADGSVTIQPPEGVSVDNGIASFPAAVANEALPLPEQLTIQSDGSVNVVLPEGAAFNAETSQLTLPPDSAAPHDVPQDFKPVVNPDGSLTMTLPPSGVEFNPDTNSLNLANDVVNDVAPSYMEVNLDGSVNIALPEGTEFHDGGSFTVPADAQHYFDNPPPEYVHEVEFAQYNADGSCAFDLPQGAQIDDGIANFPHDVAIEHLPIPDDVTLNADGTINVGLPEGATFNADANSLNFPTDHFSPNEVPEGVQYYGNADGSWTVNLPDGMNYDAASNTVHMSNYWANEFAPEPVHIGADGSVAVELPPTTEISADGMHCTVPPEHIGFVELSAPDYVHDAPYCEPMGDGAYNVVPPEGTLVADGQFQVPHEMVSEAVPLPHDAVLLPDGGMQVPVPEGTQYDAEFNRLTFPEGALHLNEIPNGVSAHVNPDGTLTASLPEGIQYNPADGVVTMNNYWVNEFAPSSVEVSPMGDVHVTLPPAVDYQPDGSFVVPAEHADFIQNPDPAYCVGGPEWITPNIDGSVSFTPPPDVHVSPDQGVMTLSPDQVYNHFENYLPPDMTIHTDGSIEMPVPQGTMYDAQANALTLPPGELYPQDIPSGMAYTMNADGSVAVSLPPGIDYNADAGTVKFDNYWANEVAPDNVHITADGSMNVTLPPHTQYYPEGGFSVPPAYADFIDNPPPPYAYNGPEWVNCTPDGAVHFTPPPEFHVNSEMGTVTAPAEVMAEHFENHIPDDLIINADGTVNVQLPAYAQFDAANGVVTFPADSAHMHMPPPQLQPYFNADGSLSVKLPDGISFDSASNQVHLDNYWTNELAPANVEFHPDGQVHVQLPADTHYHDGGFSVPSHEANFMEDPQPYYVSEGPEWVTNNPDGSFVVQPPTGMMVDSAAGVVAMPIDMFMNDTHIAPDDMRFFPDGTAELKLPEGTAFDAASNQLSFPAGSVHMHEIPPQIPAIYQPDGSISVNLPEGIAYNADTGAVHLSNAWLNELAPEPITFTENGSVQIQLPPDTQFFPNGAFVVSSDSAGFLDEGHGPHPAPQYNGGPTPYPDYQAQHPYQQPYQAPTDSSAKVA